MQGLAGELSMFEVVVSTLLGIKTSCRDTGSPVLNEKDRLSFRFVWDDEGAVAS